MDYLTDSRFIFGLALGGVLVWFWLMKQAKRGNGGQ